MPDSQIPDNEQPGRVPVRFPVLMRNLCVLVSYLAIVGWFGRGWLGPGLPAGDLGGTVAGLSHWRRLAETGQLLSAWSNAWFCGFSRSFFNLNGGTELAYAPFLLLGNELAAVKAGTLVYLGLAGLSAFLLLKYLVRYTPVAWLLGLAYALHPIHLSVAVADSHANFPPFYFMQPLLVLLIFRLLAKPSGRRIAALAVVGAITGWVDIERLAVLVPWLTIIVTGMLLRRAGRGAPYGKWGWAAVGRPALGLCLAVFLGTMLLAAVLLPAIMEKQAHAMFSAGEIISTSRMYSIQNPFYYLDRGGKWLADLYDHLPLANAHGAGTYYFGIVLCLLAAIGLVRRQPSGRLRLLFSLVLICWALALATAHGPFSGYQSHVLILREILSNVETKDAVGGRLLLFINSIVGFFLVLLFVIYRFRDRGKSVLPVLLLVAAVPAVILFVTPYKWFFAYIPPYATMRNPAWFATAMPPLASVLAAAIGLLSLLRAIRSRIFRFSVLLLVAVLLAWDISAYRPSFDNRSPASFVDELEDISGFLARQEGGGRILSRERYNPHADMLYAYSGRPAGFYWLNWMAPALMSRYMLEEVYPRLEQQGALEPGLANAGRAYVRYLLFDRLYGPLPPPVNALRQVHNGRFFVLYENRLCRPYADLLPRGSAAGKGSPPGQDPGVVRTVARPRSDLILVEAAVAIPAVLVVAESWFARWTVTVDGEAAQLHRVNDAFIGVSLEPGTHAVRFEYKRAWYFYAGGAVSGLAVLLCIGLLAGLSASPGRQNDWHGRERTV